MVTIGKDSPDSGILVETVPMDGDEASLLSNGTSIGSATLDFPDGVTFYDLVDLRGGNFCRVLMRGDRGRPPRVCGCPIMVCRRANHDKKRLGGEAKGVEGWYVRYGTKHGYPDGRSDLDIYSDAEAMELKAEAARKDQEDLQAFLPPSEEIVFESEEDKPTALKEPSPHDDSLQTINIEISMETISHFIDTKFQNRNKSV